MYINAKKYRKAKQQAYMDASIIKDGESDIQLHRVKRCKTCGIWFKTSKGDRYVQQWKAQNRLDCPICRWEGKPAVIKKIEEDQGMTWAEFTEKKVQEHSRIKEARKRYNEATGLKVINEPICTRE